MSSPSVFVTIAENPPKRLDKALARDVPEEAHLSRSRLSRLIEDGCVLRDGVICENLRASVKPGEVFEIRVPEEADTHILPEDISLDILFEDDDLIVVNKPVGMVVHPAPGTPSGTLVNALLFHFGGNLSGVGGKTRPGIVHRIDKDTSGILVVAKSDRAHHGLAKQFEKHSIKRTYTAICYGCPDTGDPRLMGLKGVNKEPGGVVKVTTMLGRHRTDRQKQAVSFDKGKHAVTRIRTLRKYGRPGVVALVECKLETGRTHQIRVHMAYLGHGLIGDATYGGRRRIAGGSLSEVAQEVLGNFPRQALHAAELGFDHPVSGKAMMFEAPLPSDMAAMLAALQS